MGNTLQKMHAPVEKMMLRQPARSFWEYLKDGEQLLFTTPPSLWSSSNMKNGIEWPMHAHVIPSTSPHN